ncbi:MAG: hypothetical protein N4A49_05385 [Marinifilaceae bacterium]|jgi:hypothetical protein|nr:hypothetical protein [Marinifilaceae bacterium]
MKNLLFTLIIGLTIISCSKSDDDKKTYGIYGNWKGTFNGGDSGSWVAVFHEDGNVTGSANSKNTDSMLDLEGSINEDGEFNATIGNSSTGAEFKGKISGNKISGKWTNEYYEISGDFEGKHQ